MASYLYAVKTLLENRINELPLTSKNLEEILKKEGWKVVYYDLNSQNSINILSELN